jgi:hypothetical protein
MSEMPKPPESSPLLLSASLIGFAVVVTAALLLFRAKGALLAGLAAPLYYIILVGLGGFAALLLVGVMNGYAVWTGQVIGGNLKLGGAVAVAALTVVGGSYFRPEKSSSLVVRVVGEDIGTQLPCPTEVRLMLGMDDRPGEIGQSCQAQFNEIPERFLSSSGLDVRIILPGYVRVNSDPVSVSQDHVLTVVMRRTAEKSIAWGRLIYPSQKPVQFAHISINGQAMPSDSGETGQFRFEVPLPEGREVQFTVDSSGSVVFDQKLTLPIASTLTVH